jgi:hypothetical protein
MPNHSGSVYGLTILSPIRDDSDAEIPHNLAIRTYLAKLPRDQNSPFAKVFSTHMARLAVLDDVVYVGTRYSDRLKVQYLIFESNFDGDLDTYLKQLAAEATGEVNSIWQHCIGYPGAENVGAFIAYMKRCQVETTFYFAHVNNKTVQQTLQALHTQNAVAAFIERNQGKHGAELQTAFVEFLRSSRYQPQPRWGAAAEKVLDR